MKVVECDENRTAQCATMPDKTNIRIRNISEYEFCNVELVIEFGLDPPKANYGIVEDGDYSCYHPFEYAYRNALLFLSINGEKFNDLVSDFSGEQPIGPGNFTYEVDIVSFDRGNISMELVKED